MTATVELADGPTCQQCSCASHVVAARYCLRCGTALPDLSASVSWRELKRLALFYVLFIALTLPIVWVPRTLVGYTVVTVGLAQGLLVALFLPLIAGNIRRQFSVNHVTRIWTGIGLATLVVVLPINVLMCRLISQALGLEPRTLSDLLGHMSFPVMCVAIAVMPAIVEEIAFRGILFTRLAPVVGSVQAIVLTGVLFGVIHGDIPSLPYLSAFGCMLAWLRYRTGSLWPGILVHFAHNLAVLAYEQSTQAGPS